MECIIIVDETALVPKYLQSYTTVGTFRSLRWTTHVDSAYSFSKHSGTAERMVGELRERFPDQHFAVVEVN